MVKAHTPINWENEPSYNTPLNAANLNKMDSEIGILDDRIIEQDTIKLDKATANTMVKAISFDENTGVFTITLLNGSTTKIDTKLEKVVVNFGYDATTQQIILNLVDGTTQYIDLSALITQYEFVDSDTIGWEVTTDGKVKAKILDGSITENMLQPNYLADIRVETAKSQQSMENAKISETNAKESELLAKQYAEDANMYESMVADTVNGNNPTATNSTDGNVTYLKNSGYTKQDGTPTPDAPIEIKGLGDSGTIEVKTCGKNLFAFGKTAIDKTSEYRSEVTQRLIISSVDGNQNDIKCGYNGGNYSMGYIVLDGIDGTKDYKFSYEIIENTTSYTPSITKDESRSTETQLVIIVNGENKDNAVSTDNYFVVTNIQVEEGTVATTYEPYTETVAYIPVSSPLYDGDYIEVYADGSGKIVRTMGSVVYDGSESGWNKGGSANGLFYILKPTNSKTSQTSLFCSHYVKSTSGTTYTTDKTTNINIGNYWIIDSRFSTVDEWKTWLQSNPVTVVYELETPTTEPLTAEQVTEFMKLQTFKGVTHVNADGEVTVRYYCNNDSGETVGMLHDRIDVVESDVAELPDKYASKTIYGDTIISLGRKKDTTVGTNSVAIGFDVTATGSYSHAEGCVTTAMGSSSHAEGQGTNALGKYSHAEGYATQALKNQHAQGHYNDTSLAKMNTDVGTSNGTAFVIGNGALDSPSNAFRVTGNGEAIGKASFASTGADYAEYFEWQDENPNNEDRVGYFVTFADGNLIKKATEGDYVLGIVSGMPCVIGNNDECWMKQFELDEWGRYIYETHSGINEETGEEKEYTFYKVNPDYDSSKEYIHRKERPEWSAVGMIGVLSVYDDGTCQVNGYCKCTNGGIATACERGIDTYRVIARVTDNIVKIVLKS